MASPQTATRVAGVADWCMQTARRARPAADRARSHRGRLVGIVMGKRHCVNGASGASSRCGCKGFSLVLDPGARRLPKERMDRVGLGEAMLVAVLSVGGKCVRGRTAR